MQRNTRDRIEKGSAQVMKTRYPLGLKEDVFSFRDPKRIAQCLKRSALKNRRRKSNPFRSALSTLNFHMSRHRTNLDPAQRNRLNKAKEELRRIFHKIEEKPTRRAVA